jgi:hypothetical protein
MTRHALASVLVAGLVLLAGCSGGLTGTPTEESALDGGTTAEEIEGDTGTVNMYISDERNAIEDFEHLNATITRVGSKPAGEGEGADDGDADDTETEDVETADDTNTTDAEEPEVIVTHRGGEAELEAELGDGSGGNGTTTAVEDDSQYRLTAG